jgi:hypothetical protein
MPREKSIAVSKKRDRIRCFGAVGAPLKNMTVKILWCPANRSREQSVTP